MSADLVPASDAAALESDPVEYMAVVLNRAKGWLAEAQSIESVRETRAVAVGYESVIREKELAFDAQLSATEIVRRCERRIGELVREGQERGEIRKRGDIGGNRIEVPRGDDLLSPKVILPHAQERTAHYVMADAPADQFEQAIGDARDEGNLSRANVVRKVKGEKPKPRNTDQPETPLPTAALSGRDRMRAEAHKRRLIELISTLNGFARGLDAIDITRAHQAMDDAERAEWARSLGTALAAFHRLRSELKGDQP